MHDESNGQGNEHGHHDKFTIIINGRRQEVDHEYVTYEDIVFLRYDGNPPSGDDWVFSISYRNGPHENPHGTLSPGQSVKVKNGMIFDVTATNKS